MNEEIRQIIERALTEEYNKGFLQGVWQFYQHLKTTHATPEEIFELLKSVH